MPATRANIRDLVLGSTARSRATTTGPNIESSLTLKATATLETAEAIMTKVESSTDAPYFPRSDAERASFRTCAGKKVTPHQWAVYDYILDIPAGKVATYKSVCDGLGQGSPRSVGSALRNNPFAPFVPCHRVISSDLYLGGYCGEWGPKSKTGTQFNRKLQLLRDEGVDFDEKGTLRSKDKLI